MIIIVIIMLNMLGTFSYYTAINYITDFLPNTNKIHKDSTPAFFKFT